MPDCGVCIGYDGDYDSSPEFYEVKIVRARKEHRCVECRRVIAKGAEYERQSGKFDGQMFADKICMDCRHIRDGLSCGESVMTGTLWESIGEVFGEVTTGCLTKIETASAKGYFLERWREWKGLAPEDGAATAPNASLDSDASASKQKGGE